MSKEKNLDWMSASPEDVDLVGKTSVVEKEDNNKDFVEEQEKMLEMEKLEVMLKESEKELGKLSKFKGKKEGGKKNDAENNIRVIEKRISELKQGNGSGSVKWTEMEDRNLDQEKLFQKLEITGKKGKPIEEQDPDSIKTEAEQKTKITEPEKGTGFEFMSGVDEMGMLVDKTIEDKKGDKIVGEKEGTSYELSDEQFEKIKLFFKESEEDELIDALETLVSDVMKENFVLNLRDGSLVIVKESENVRIVELFNDKKKINIRIELDSDKKSINVNVEEMSVEPETEAESKIEPEVPETPEPEPTPEKEKELRTTREVIEELELLERLKIFESNLKNRIEEKARIEKDIDEKIKNGEKITQEDEIKRDKASEEVQMAKINVTTAKGVGVSLEVPIKGDTNDEMRILNKEIMMTELLLKQYEVLGKMGEEQDRKSERLNSEKQEGLKKYWDAATDKIYSKLPNWITDKGANNSQQAGEPKERWYNKELSVESIKEIFGRGKKEKGDERKEIDEAKFKQAVAVEVLGTLSDENIERIKNTKIEIKLGKVKNGVEGEGLNKIAEKLFNQYGGEDNMEEFREKIAEINLNSEDIKKAVEIRELDEIEEPKGFRDVVEEIEGVDDLDEVIKYLKGVIKMFEKSEKSVEKEKKLLLIVTNYKERIVSEDENELKKVKEELEINKNDIENFKSILLREDDLMKLFKGIEGLCEKETGEVTEEIKEMISELEDRHNMDKIKNGEDLMKLLFSVNKYIDTFSFRDRPEDLNKIYFGISRYLYSDPNEEDYAGYVSEIISEMKIEVENIELQEFKEYCNKLIDKIEEYENKEDDEEDSGEGENGEEITDERKKKVKEAFKGLDDLDEDIKKDIEKSFIKANNLLDREVLSLWENNSANDFVQGNKEAFEGVTIGQIIEIMGENSEDNNETEQKTADDRYKETQRIAEKMTRDIESKIEIGIGKMSDDEAIKFGKDLNKSIAVINNRSVFMDKTIEMLKDVGLTFNDMRKIDNDWLIKTVSEICEKIEKNNLGETKENIQEQKAQEIGTFFRIIGEGMSEMGHKAVKEYDERIRAVMKGDPIKKGDTLEDLKKSFSQWALGEEWSPDFKFDDFEKRYKIQKELLGMIKNVKENFERENVLKSFYNVLVKKEEKNKIYQEISEQVFKNVTSSDKNSFDAIKNMTVGDVKKEVDFMIKKLKIN